MPSLERAVLALSEDRQKAEAAKLTADAEKEKAHVAESYGRLSRLLANQDMAWFMRTYVSPIVEEERRTTEDITDPTITAEKRDRAAHRLATAKKIAEILQSETTVFRNRLEALSQ